MQRLFPSPYRIATLARILFDIVLVLACIVVGFAVQPQRIEPLLPIAGTQALSLAAGLFLINTATGFYEGGRRRSAWQRLLRAMLSLALAVPMTWAIFSLLPADFHSRELVRWIAVVGVAAVTIRRVVVSQGHASAPGRQRVMIFGAGPAAADVGRFLSEADRHIRIVGYVPGPNEQEVAVDPQHLRHKQGPLDRMARELQADEIIVALTERRAGSMPLRELLDCKVAGVKVHDINTHFEKSLGQIRIDYLNASWMIFGDGFNQGVLRSSVKRFFDVVCSCVLIVLTLPLMLVTALAIKLESPGPVLYRQERVGRHGRPFQVIKFRSMRTDAEKDGRPRWASTDDDRITRVGRIIRRVRIDELPQLFNVLSGEMSLVGPRPERPFFVEQLTREIPYFAVRQSVKPGVTGWAQVRYHYGATVEDSQSKLQYDLYYVKNHSLLLDLLILLETVNVVLTGKGAR